ncbi:CDP-alcohol phosphatidyltransferase family protein [Pilimelia terevasa]|uniref:CDP-alcohol phosphatidyltransferase family protein n=1 Tax=Pilimelia terevasa TaxID=53372 RepID=UPI001E602936|nr:CDP-alcohol phosphatidyltransferase family protein [Pilimelia terevasa]
MHGGLDPRTAAAPVRGWLRLSYRLGRVGGRLGVRPAAVTVVGLVASAAVPAAAAAGPPGLLAAAVLVLAAALADSVDGAVAVVTGRTSQLGHVHDALADRLGELCWAGAFWLVGVPWQLCAAVVAVGWLYEYACAQAAVAAMSYRGRAPVADRPVRVGLAAGGLLLAGAAGLLAPELAAGTATLVMTIWVAGSLYGLGQLLTVLRTGRVPARS